MDQGPAVITSHRAVTIPVPEPECAVSVAMDRAHPIGGQAISDGEIEKRAVRKPRDSVTGPDPERSGRVTGECIRPRTAETVRAVELSKVRPLPPPQTRPGGANPENALSVPVQRVNAIC